MLVQLCHSKSLTAGCQLVWHWAVPLSLAEGSFACACTANVPGAAVLSSLTIATLSAHYPHTIPTLSERYLNAYWRVQGSRFKHLALRARARPVGLRSLARLSARCSGYRPPRSSRGCRPSCGSAACFTLRAAYISVTSPSHLREISVTSPLHHRYILFGFTFNFVDFAHARMGRGDRLTLTLLTLVTTRPNMRA